MAMYYALCTYLDPGLGRYEPGVERETPGRAKAIPEAEGE